MPLATFLNDAVPAQLRGLQWLALSETGMVLSLTSVDDSGGGATQTWGTTVTGVPCRIDPVGSTGRDLLAGRIDERSTHVITIPSGTNVTVDNRFQITGRGTFEVTAQRDQTGEMARTFEVLQIS